MAILRGEQNLAEKLEEEARPAPLQASAESIICAGHLFARHAGRSNERVECPRPFDAPELWLFVSLAELSDLAKRESGHATRPPGKQADEGAPSLTAHTMGGGAARSEPASQRIDQCPVSANHSA